MRRKTTEMDFLFREAEPALVAVIFNDKLLVK